MHAELKILKLRIFIFIFLRIRIQNVALLISLVPETHCDDMVENGYHCNCLISLEAGILVDGVTQGLVKYASVWVSDQSSPHFHSLFTS